jgi:hypothetical protein
MHRVQAEGVYIPGTTRYKARETINGQKPLLIYYRHFINKDFKLKSYLLAIKDLNDIYSGVYMLSVLLKALKQYDIKI